MSRRGRGGQPPFNPRALTQYRSLLAPEYPRPTLPSVDNMDLYEVPITWETPPPIAILENIPPTPVPAPPVQNYEQPLDYLMSDPELQAAMLNFPHFYMEPLEEPPVLTMDEMIAQERDRLLREETIAETNYKKWLREYFGLTPPSQ
ncbi:hypothetical protein RHGRI_014137 [Rhododendron griersonianum]|uniref:Uncharacterized protein n=2 Tax=Rhododendron griersonianum TaxID=479676 RepID=A0AAV6K8A2_9ERIC|nr:hypothetical protein RHGRI_014137 [Rhododendron griersonianum]